MKNWILLIVATLFFVNCSGSKETTSVAMVDTEPQIEVLVLANQCTDKEPLELYEFNGIGFTKMQTLDRVGKDSFMLRMAHSEPKFLYLGTESQAKLPVILSDQNLKIEGSCKNFRNSKISGSEENELYAEVLKNIRSNKQALQGKLNQYRRAGNDTNLINLTKKELNLLDQKHLAYLDSIQSQNAFLANIAGLGTMESFPNKAAEYNNNEVDFFAAEYFKQVDLKNPALDRIPYLFESFKEYAQTLASVNLKEDIVQNLIDQNLSKVPVSSKAMRYALGGVVIALQAKNHSLFPAYGNQFIKQFGANTDEASITRLKSQIARAKSFGTGGEAPDIVMDNLEGESIKLSELRGNVVLIDFWASWCGPCRRENPNVVRVYNKYNDKGFEILGVSLDRTKDKWAAAIEKDGLTWLHVSDLKGWQNEAAQLYGVRSIPHTVLLDREGKIIARNLRGPALERKLAEIFGGN
jgi:thiol-disulfide isomerase/thioredoxin